MKTKTLGTAIVAVGLLIILHHLIVAGGLFDIADMWHHEFFGVILFTAGITMLITLHNN